jgi:hypothetical protein
MFPPTVGLFLKPKVPGYGIKGIHIVVAPAKAEYFAISLTVALSV